MRSRKLALLSCLIAVLVIGLVALAGCSRTGTRARTTMSRTGDLPACVANAKGVATAAIMYAVDYKETLPQATDPASFESALTP